MITYVRSLKETVEVVKSGRKIVNQQVSVIVGADFEQDEDEDQQSNLYRLT